MLWEDGYANKNTNIIYTNECIIKLQQNEIQYEI